MIKVQYTSFLYFLVCLTFLERIIRDVFVLNNMKFKSVAIFTLLLMRRRFSTLLGFCRGFICSQFPRALFKLFTYLICDHSNYLSFVCFTPSRLI